MTKGTISPVRVNPVLTHPGERRISLDGQWRLRLDPEEKGLAEKWYAQPEALTDPIVVPGCWQGQGYGDASNDTVWDFHFQVRTFQATYKGTGWYSKVFDTPSDWQG